MNWTRVTALNKCPVCGHSSWCVYTQKTVLCMRVESDHPKPFVTGEMGWFHKQGGWHMPPAEQRQQSKAVLNVGKTIREWSQWNRKAEMYSLAESLGVSFESLSVLGCTKAPWHKTWAFPMRDGEGCYTGIRLRHENGDKWAVKGSHQGIFLPEIPSNSLAIITEGVTDTAAALTIGYYALGRPSCSGGTPLIRRTIRRLNIRRAIIVADNDDPGLRGAQMLCNHLPVPTCILVLPCKDMREFVNNGGTAPLLNSMTDGLVWKVGGALTALPVAHQPTE